MKIALFAALAAVTLSPAAIAQTAPAAAPAAAAAAKFNLDTPVQDIVADSAAKAALDASLPGVTTHEAYEMFKGMSLRQLATQAPDKLTPEALATAEKALAAVK